MLLSVSSCQIIRPKEACRAPIKRSSLRSSPLQHRPIHTSKSPMADKQHKTNTAILLLRLYQQVVHKVGLCLQLWGADYRRLQGTRLVRTKSVWSEGGKDQHNEGKVWQTVDQSFGFPKNKTKTLLFKQFFYNQFLVHLDDGNSKLYLLNHLENLIKITQHQGWQNGIK